MKDSKLIQTLRTFTKDEIKQFEKFIVSPFFNNGRNYLPFLKLLLNFYPDFNDPKEELTSEFIYQKLYPGRKFNRQVMWNQISQLEKLALEFLLHSELKNNKSERFKMMFDVLSEKNLGKQIIKEIEKADGLIGDMKFGEEYFSLKWIIENSKTGYWNSVQGRQDKTLDGTINSTDYLVLKFLVELSVQVWDLHILKIMYNSGDDLNSVIEFVGSLGLKELVETAEKDKNRFSSVIKFYYNKIMCALDENEEKYFFEMKKFFDTNYILFDKIEQSNTIITLANYCAHKMRLGSGEYLRILFDINKFRLEKKIGVFENGRINKALFHQILRNALSLGEIEFSENFVMEYSPKLKKEHQKTMTSLALGYINYAKKDYAESLYYLNKVEYIDIRDKLHVRILSAKAYYELGDSESLYYFIDSSKHFIGNNTDIEKDTKAAYQKFFNYLGKLLSCKDNPERHTLKLLRENIDKDKIIRLRHKKWLLEKSDQL